MPAPTFSGAVVFRRTPKGVRLLILRAYNLWDFPKVPIDETTGLSDLDYPFGDEFKDTLPHPGSQLARYYLAETGTEKVVLPISSDLGRPVHDEWRWVGFDEAEDYLPPRLAVVLGWARATLSS
jgi:8-oxo-dGTP pyrophosphatase MutT (NUDIX family)